MPVREQTLQTPSKNELLEQLMHSALRADAEYLKRAIDALNGKTPATPKPTLTAPLLLGMGKAAEVLGVSRPTFWRMIRAGRIAKFEILPGSYRVRREDIEALLSREELLESGDPKLKRLL
jgi:excisionase family DNA binding protein